MWIEKPGICVLLRVQTDTMPLEDSGLLMIELKLEDTVDPVGGIPSGVRVEEKRALSGPAHHSCRT